LAICSSPLIQPRIDALIVDGLIRERSQKNPNRSLLVTTDADVAKKYGMIDETEFLE
jgi:hypothetical protein